jgi:hypothetical protein
MTGLLLESTEAVSIHGSRSRGRGDHAKDTYLSEEAGHFAFFFDTEGNRVGPQG